MEVHTFCKVFLVFIFLINHFNCIFGADELSIEIANKTLVPKVDEKILNNFSEVNSSQGTDFQPKSRRKRYVAFPEGSSFSVKCSLSIFENECKIFCDFNRPGSVLCNSRFYRKSTIYLYELGLKLGRSL